MPLAVKVLQQHALQIGNDIVIKVDYEEETNQSHTDLFLIILNGPGGSSVSVSPVHVHCIPMAERNQGVTAHAKSVPACTHKLDPIDSPYIAYEE
jgi:hypothetical protein